VVVGRFPLAVIEEEVAAKEASLVRGLNTPIATLLARCAESLPAAVLPVVRNELDFVRSKALTTPEHPSVGAYLSHPIRVATLGLTLTDKPNLEIVQIGLVHNIFEVSGLNEARLKEAGYSERVASAVRQLTIDRARETDVEYLQGFHEGIVAFGPPLPLVRTVDKLDNLLGLAILADGPVRDSYIDLAERFVLPLAESVDCRLARYFASAIAYQRATGCRVGVRRSYERFVASTS
jgi:(p)ppGpp synthase/HD superfamily hydrolase